MCRHCLTLPTNALVWNIGKKLYNTFACGKCPECVTAYRNQWKRRAYFEFLDFQKRGGFSMFVTLTYAPSFLPHVREERFTRIDEETGEVVQLPCFDRSDVLRFFDNLDYRLEKYYGRASYHYFVACEYGETYGRCHYHLILNFDYPVEELLRLRNMVTDSWSKRMPCKQRVTKWYVHNGKRVKRSYVRKTCIKSLGIVDFGKKYPDGVIRNIRAVQYICDYLQKSDFVDTHNKLIESLPDEEKKDYLKKYGPFRLSSRSYGICLLNYPELFDVDSGTVLMQTKKGYEFVSMPMYYKRKLYFYTDSYKCYHLNDIGIARKVADFNKLQQYITTKILTVLSHIKDNFDESKELFDSFAPLIDGLELPFADYIECYEETIARVGLTRLVNYYLVLHNRVHSSDVVNSTGDLLPHTYNIDYVAKHLGDSDYMCDLYHKLLCYQNNVSEGLYSDLKDNKKLFNYLKTVLVNKVKPFSHYASFFEMFEIFNDIYETLYNRYDRTDENDLIIRKIKNAYVFST